MEINVAEYERGFYNEMAKLMPRRLHRVADAQGGGLCWLSSMQAVRIDAGGGLMPSRAFMPGQNAAITLAFHHVKLMRYESPAPLLRVHLDRLDVEPSQAMVAAWCDEALPDWTPAARREAARHARERMAEGRMAGVRMVDAGLELTITPSQLLRAAVWIVRVVAAHDMPRPQLLPRPDDTTLPVAAQRMDAPCTTGNTWSLLALAVQRRARGMSEAHT